ncbi:flagellar assembly protein FliH [Marinomonas ostreistagni]|uniref:flagellar assembly protein FliH n=1 Tax=Marinomonas ostreistagni TaxID=359209 RepID=UPI00194ED4DF|nr:flagellar assembly protein FliH [Marinomonas ostreistagni]MBM6551244.1 flagellar assembly protein FliH [Marinomonas ostreistagni]
MSDDNPSEKKLTAYERWELPNLNSGQQLNAKKPSAALAIKPEEDEAIEVTEEFDQDSVVYEPLTAQQLEEIRSAAYEEGFAQGVEEGQQKGYEEGLVKGQEAGQQEGFAAGLEQGAEQAKTAGIELAQTQLADLEQLLNNVLKEFESPLEQSREVLESLLLTSTKRIAEHVVRRELSEDSNKLLNAELSKVLQAIGESDGRAVLRVHPDSLEAAHELAVDTRLQIKIKTDESLMAGGFILDSHSFYVDGSVETRLKEVLKSLEKSDF